MRKELNTAGLIERYLSGAMPADEKQAFERSMSEISGLRESVELQREIQRGIESYGLKVQAAEAYRSYRIHKAVRNLGAALVLAGVAAAILWYLFGGFASETGSEVEQPAPAAEASRYLPAQTFVIHPDRDTVVETERGIILLVPAHCFTDRKGRPVKEPVQLKLQEALDAASIIRAGLSTRSGERLLESAGMFYINAHANKEALFIDPQRGISLQLPADRKNPEMMLFEGHILPDGSMNWKAPQPLDNFLIPRDIATLSFYPPLYLDSLSRMGYDIRNKAFTDSLYYSFASLFSGSGKNIPKGVNPAKIKAVWNEEFQRTLLATKEFEERLQYIHTTCEEGILDMYVRNLEKKISEIDSLVYKQYGLDKFREFAQRREGRVIAGPGSEKLKLYFEQKYKVYTRAAAKAEQEFQRKQDSLDAVHNKKRDRQRRMDLYRQNANLQGEYRLNLLEAYRQLGMEEAPLPAPAYYSVTVTTTGWKNVDAYVMEATQKRETLNYTDKKGRKATIRYTPISVGIAEKESYDRITAYLLPDSLYSFMRMKEEGSRYTEKLDGILAYKLLCVGYRKDQVFCYLQDSVSPGNYLSLALQPITAQDLENLLNKEKPSMEETLREEIRFQQEDTHESRRQRMLYTLKQLNTRIAAFIFPCQIIPPQNTPYEM
jgi:hypothetical protein